MIINHKNRQIKLCDEILNIIKQYRQLEQYSTEAGGVLIGRESESNDNLIIEYITEPMKQDKRSRCRFNRKDKGHVEFYNETYKNNNEIYRYVGEWHTHPQSIPWYSSIDYSNWRKIGKAADGQSIQIHLIAGNEALGIWEYSCVTKTVTFICNLFWDKV